MPCARKASGRRSTTSLIDTDPRVCLLGVETANIRRSSLTGVKSGSIQKRHPSRSAFAVEMAGIEPASEKFDHPTSTSLAGLLKLHRRAPGRRGSYDGYPMTPKRAS